MNARLFAASAAFALLATMLLPCGALAAVEDLPGMDTATNMREWLKLSDAQVAQLQPVIATRLQRVDAAIQKVEAAEHPDVTGFIEELGKARKDFNEGVARILSPDQQKQWASFKAELEKDLVQSAAKKQVKLLTPVLKLTDAQAKWLVGPFAVATQKKLDVFQQLSDGGRISLREKLKAKRALGDIKEELEKSMGMTLSPEQMAAYKQATSKK
jgi:hypothetical protein